ncbi:hypothetical protein NDU88_002635 [Pleurodeles waltl]|uniref:Uncharacterized protein n=1 Tax=Pleurodeles waltl TaxID=8319 RepID=A0AAV7V0A3_PLEWA|nr:hypothetical protein NDU88_002635 [Pleurodeles waltl]
MHTTPARCGPGPPVSAKLEGTLVRIPSPRWTQQCRTDHLCNPFQLAIVIPSIRNHLLASLSPLAALYLVADYRCIGNNSGGTFFQFTCFPSALVCRFRWALTGVSPHPVSFFVCRASIVLKCHGPTSRPVQ